VVTIPAHTAVGAADLVLTNPDGQSATLVSAFSYVAPMALQIHRLEPSSGPTTGNTGVLVSGTGLDEVVQVRVGDQKAPSFKVQGSERLAFLTPPRRGEGVVDVELHTRDGRSLLRKNAFRYTAVAPPQIRTISPNRAGVTGGSEITISGEHFIEGSLVLLDDKPVESVKIRDTKTIVFKTPPGVPGRMVDVAVKSPAGQVAVSKRALMYDPRYR
jgi:hypothetical protein